MSILLPSRLPVVLEAERIGPELTVRYREHAIRRTTRMSSADYWM